jgi:hypothetical protein
MVCWILEDISLGCYSLRIFIYTHLPPHNQFFIKLFVITIYQPIIVISLISRIRIENHFVCTSYSNRIISQAH